MPGERCHPPNEYYDLIAARYEERFMEVIGAEQTARQVEFLEHLLPRRCSVLDLACGSGRHALRLAGKGFHVLGVDLSGEMLGEANKKLKRFGVDCDLIRANMMHIPVVRSSFDAVLALWNPFCEIQGGANRSRVMKEVSRVLKSDGVGVLDFPNPIFYEKAEGRRPDGDHWELDEVDGARIRYFYHYYTHAELETLIAGSKLEVTGWYGDYSIEAIFDCEASEKMILTVRKKR